MVRMQRVKLFVTFIRISRIHVNAAGNKERFPLHISVSVNHSERYPTRLHELTQSVTMFAAGSERLISE